MAKKPDEAALSCFDLESAGLSIRDARVLSTILFWFPKGDARSGGQRFFADTKKDLAKKANLSFKQVKTALPYLVSYGLIRTEVHEFHDKKRMFVLPLVSTLNEVQTKGPFLKGQMGPLVEQKAQKDLSKGPKRTDSKGPFCANLLTVLPTSVLSTESKDCIGADAPRDPRSDQRAGFQEKASKQACSGRSESCGQASLEAPDTVPVVGLPERGSNVIQFPKRGRFADMPSVQDMKTTFDDIQEATRNASAAPKKHDPANPAALRQVWQAALQKSAVYVPPLTGKQVGMFKNIAASVPEGMAAPILQAVGRDWEDFKDTMEADFGAYKFSAKPQLDLVNKHIAAVVTWFLNAKKEAEDLAEYHEKAAAKKASQEAAQAPKLSPAPTSPPEVPGAATPQPVVPSKASKVQERTPLDRFKLLVECDGASQARMFWLAKFPSLPEGAEEFLAEFSGEKNAA